jgi:hypothetical protein
LPPALPASLPPFALDTLSTRMTWAPLPGGENASLQNLQFRTAQGQSLAPVTIDWQWQQPKGGATQARLQTGALDLGTLSALAQRLPCPRCGTRGWPPCSRRAGSPRSRAGELAQGRGAHRPASELSTTNPVCRPALEQPGRQRRAHAPADPRR